MTEKELYDLLVIYGVPDYEEEKSDLPKIIEDIKMLESHGLLNVELQYKKGMGLIPKSWRVTEKGEEILDSYIPEN
ncbi:hypothetical protein CW674_05940 [Macrococcoides caseolyticum]|uniref:hypothetical protein n=1 Tax=Macrococcoides caseolyticum TaxID=69966 RepID=UPI000C342811|nr:hypothetical protein [Macrococcus caseolyticus]PKE65669.1 hypothetical protein CW674_05940 [Macrococcus caseolyticus]